MREFLAEVHHRAWIATALVSALAAACALLHFALPAALAAMAAGAMLMWISEEESRLVAAMAPGPDPAPAIAPAPAPARDAAIRIREWANPFPAPPSARRQRPHGRRTRRQGVTAAIPSD